MTDIVFITPNNHSVTYQGLASAGLSAVEPPTWALLLSESMRSKGFNVAIIDTLAEGLSDAQLEVRVQNQIDKLNEKINYLTPPELPKSSKKKGEKDEGVVGRYTLAARQRNREINYSSASRQLQDLYTCMMDGQEQKIKRSNKKSRVVVVSVLVVVVVVKTVWFLPC